MDHVKLGTTNLIVSRIAFGAGPIPELMTEDDGSRQQAVLRRALDAGINWIDTAASYGNGQSESSLGASLNALDAVDAVQIATKVRLMPEELGDIPGCVRRSIDGSLDRLGVQRVALLQLHNSITARRGDEPTSVTPEDVMGSGGILEQFRRLQDRGLVDQIGLTGIGQAAALQRVIDSGEFATIQTPFNVLNPSAGHTMPNTFDETDYGNLVAACARQQMGVFAIRVFAGGALVGNQPAAHTYKTKFFPLDLYHRDQKRREGLQDLLPVGSNLAETAIRFVLSHASITSAIIGFSEPWQIDEAMRALASGPLEWSDLVRLRSIAGIDS